MVEQKLTTQQIIALRKAALFNVKARNVKVYDIFNDNTKRGKELEIERQKIATVLMKKAGIRNPDTMLEKVNDKGGTYNENQLHRDD
jgi:hypothetical protein